MKILVFGNPLVEMDSIALNVMKSLQNRFPDVEFREFDSAENLENEGRDLIILDAAVGVPEVVILEGIEKLQSGSIYSMHDFDLSLTLKLLIKMGKIDRVRIIAIPSDYEKEKAVEECSLLISSLL